MKVYSEPSLLKWFDRANDAFLASIGAGTAASILTSWHSWVWLASLAMACVSFAGMHYVSRVLCRPMLELRRRGVN